MGKKGFAKKSVVDKKKERAINEQSELGGAGEGWLPAAKSLKAAGKKEASEHRGIRKDKSDKRQGAGKLAKPKKLGGSVGSSTPLWAQPLRQVQDLGMTDA